MDWRETFKCRACLNENDSLMPLFDVYEHELTLADILQRCTNSEVKDDGLPRYLCENCINVVTQFYNFYELYEQNLVQLRETLLTKEGAQNVDETCETNPNFENVEERGEEGESLVVKEEIIHEDELEGEFRGGSPEDEESCMDETSYMSDENESVISQDVMYPNVTTSPRIIEKEDGMYEERTKYECADCGDSFLFKSGIVSHMFKRHGIKGIDPESYGVQILVKVNKRPTMPIVNNSQNQEKTKVYSPKCMMCKQVFESAELLKTHMMVHKNYICDVCGAGFIKKSYLDDHKDAHSTECKYVCKYCNKRFKRRTVLVKHKKLHTHPRQCVCNTCGKRFNDNGTLKTHTLLVHIKERNFKCDICNISFALKPTLDKHVKRHMKRENGERDFICDQCGMKYRDKSSLNRHTAAQHSGGVVVKQKCHQCEKEYTSITNLLKHMRAQHSKNRRPAKSVVIADKDEDNQIMEVMVMEVAS